MMIASAVKCAHGSLNTDCHNLPHTGFNLLWLVLIAVVLVGGGVALYRAGLSADVEE